LRCFRKKNKKRYRLRERGRERIAQNVRKAREEFTKGEIRQGTVEDLMKEIVE